MDQKSQDKGYMDGRLPAAAPLANPYVPFQVKFTPNYSAQKALVRGTLFPGLDLPFMGMVNKNELPVTPLSELQAMDFVINELALYLDTHRDDGEALDLYRAYQKMYKEGLVKYEKMYGPMKHKSVGEGAYRWIDDPWPWEYAKNREV